MYVVAGFFAPDDGGISNLAALIDRSGSLAGTYSKVRPTEGESSPGSCRARCAVFKNDFGKLGLAICFDMNWQTVVRIEAGGRTVCWISAYEGGLPLQAQACMHEYAIVTSVWPYHARSSSGPER